MMDGLIKLTIGEFSKITKLSRKALRLYDKRNILTPEFVDEVTGYRYYSTRQLQEGLILSKLAWAQFSLKEMKQFKNNWQKNNKITVENLLQTKLVQVKQKVSRLKQIQQYLDDIMQSDIEKIHPEEVEVKLLPKIRVLSKRALGTYEQTISRLIGDIFQYIYSQPNPELLRVSGPTIYICHDDEYKETNADVEIAIPITGPIESGAGIMKKYLPEKKMISMLHHGPYYKLSESYSKLMVYIKSQNLKVRGHSREVYLNTPQQVLPDNLLTEIQFPLN